jgi:two-component system chemotaxis sensor kinase CheA
MIQDQELRDIYKTSSEEHLQKIEQALLHLEKHPDQEQPIEELLREAHSLKGDSRVAEVEGVENLAHSLEDVLGSIKRHELTLTPEVSDRVFERLYETLDAMNKLVHEAVTDEPSGVDVDYTVSHLLEVVNGHEGENWEDDEEEVVINTEPVFIEDDELRDIYKVSSEEHLQQLESGILYLENHPDDQGKIDELLREAHSLKGDSRIIGVESVEILAHAIEDILKSIKDGELELTGNLGDRLYQVLDGIGKIVQETVSSSPSGVDPNELYRLLKGKSTYTNGHHPKSTSEVEVIFESDLESDFDLQLPNLEENEGTPDILAALSQEDLNLENMMTTEGEKSTPFVAESSTGEIQVKKPTPPKKPKEQQPQSSVVGEPYKIDTIRVQTRLLDALMNQTGELTVTKIRIAHFATEMEKIANLWEDWKTIRSQKRFLGGTVSQSDDNEIEDRLESLISQLKSASQDNTTRLDLIAGELEEKIRTLRLLPLSNVFNFFPRLVRDLSKQEGKEVELIIQGGDTVADKLILEEIKDPLMHMIRNCVDHGLETPDERQKAGKSPSGKIWLRGYQTATNIIIEVQDDGRGLDVEKIKETAIRRGMYHADELATMTVSQIQSLIFEPSFSTRSFITEVSGRGVGLDVVRTNVDRLKGNISIESQPGNGCTFRIQLGTTLATANVLLVKTHDITQAIPIEFVQTTLLVEAEEIFTIEGRQTIALDGQAVSVGSLAELLELGSSSLNSNGKKRQQSYPCVLIKIGEEKFGLFVDEVTDTQDVVIKPQSKLLKRVRNVTGATILGTGEVCMILNPQDLLKSIQKRNLSTITSSSSQEQTKTKTKPVILLAEDSIATRTQEKRILESAGFEVVTAVDGLDGWTKLQSRKFSAIVSDVQMPNLDGLGLTAKIRQDNQYSELPIILVTSLASDEDKKRGADAGANAYIIKGKFNQDVLIETLNRLI